MGKAEWEKQVAELLERLIGAEIVYVRGLSRTFPGTVESIIIKKGDQVLELVVYVEDGSRITIRKPNWK